MASSSSVLAPSGKARFRKAGLTVFLIAVTSAYYLLNAKILLGHYDLGWHLAAGDLIRAQGKIPSQDPWSFTAIGHPWVNLSWLWDVLASAVFQRTHSSGLVVLVLACGAAITGTLAHVCRRSGAGAIAAGIAVLTAALLYPAFAAFPNIYLAASPNMATMLFAVIFYGACLARTRRIYLLPALMLLWANLHGGFLLGIFLIGIFGGVALLRRDWDAVKTYGLVACACVIASLFNPLGWHIYPAATTTVGNFVQAYITEWWPYYRNVTMPGGIPGILYILIFAALERKGRGRCPLEARLLSWLFLLLGFYQFRYMAFFFLFSAVPLALHLDGLLPKEPAVEKSLWLAGIVTGCALPLIFAQMEPGFGLAPLVSEQDARYLQAHYPRARLLNHWNDGGDLIFYLRGAIPIFVDGRAATAYPESLLRDYFPLTDEVVNEAAWDTVLAKYQIDTVLWMKSHDALRHFLVGKRGWKETYSGAYASIYVRPSVHDAP
jgi:hypothetical protein